MIAVQQARIAGVATTYRTATFHPASTPAAAARRRPSLSARITNSTPSTTRNDAAFRANAVAGPHAAMTIPASSGPSARAALNCALLSVTACSSRLRGTSSATNDCQIGVLSPPASPETNASADIHVVVAEPEATST